MIFEEKQLTLKDGRTVILKTPEMSDAAKMLDYIIAVSGETDFLLRYPDEWNGMTVESEEKVIQFWRDSKFQFDIACFDGDIAVGNCNLNFKSNAKSVHRAEVAIAIRKDYWGQGIGSAFFNEMIAAAKAYGTEIMELEYLEGNERGRRLYEKFGFKTVAEKPNATKLRDGTYLSEFYMQKYLK